MQVIATAAEIAGGALTKAAKLFAPYTRWAFLDAKQYELGGVVPVDFEAVLLAYLAGREDFFFVQIGAHEGQSGDPLTDLVIARGLSGVLVEPQPEIFAKLRSNYAQHTQLQFEQAAIAPADGTVAFYRVDPEFWHRNGLNPGSESEISSLDAAQIRFHVELFGGKALAAREAEYLISEQVPALTLKTLLSKHGVERFDLLQIDAEGFDYEILKMVEWKSAPPLIQWETVHLKVADRVAAWDLVRANGYRLYAPNSYNTLAIKDRADRGVNAVKTIADFTARLPNGEQISLADKLGKVLLVVNTASKCGFTPQYDGLEALWRKYKDRGFELVAFPCNQFGGQEPGIAEEIESFCKVNFGVSFPLMAKIDVNGDTADPLYTWLKSEAPGILGTQRVKWNFTKFLIGRDGKVVRRYGPTDKPAALESAIETLL